MDKGHDVYQLCQMNADVVEIEISPSKESLKAIRGNTNGNQRKVWRLLEESLKVIEGKSEGDRRKSKSDQNKGPTDQVQFYIRGRTS